MSERSGVRYLVLRVDDPRERGETSGHIRYEGSVEAHGQRFELAVNLSLPEGTATSSLTAPALQQAERDKLQRAAAALVRAATRSGVAEGRPVPRKIHRWRDH